MNKRANRSKYLNLARINRKPGGVPINQDIDFEVELLENVKYNVHRILMLLQEIVTSKAYSREIRDKKIAEILDNIKDTTDEALFLKSDLIKAFVEQVLPHYEDKGEDYDIEEAFDKFMDEQRKKTLEEISQKYGVPTEKINKWLSDYAFSQIFDDQELKNSITKEEAEEYKEKNNLTLEKIFSVRLEMVRKIKDSIIQILDKYN